MRNGLRQALQSSGYPLGLRPAGSAVDLLDGLIEVVVLDYSQIGFDEALENFGARDVGLVVIGGSIELQSELSRAERLRGWALLPAEASDEAILGAVLATHSGLLVGDRLIAGTMAAPSLPDESDPLSDREREILKLMSDGMANKQISAQLNLSIHTVKFHIASLMAKLEASSRTEAVTLGIRRGLVVL